LLHSESLPASGDADDGASQRLATGAGDWPGAAPAEACGARDRVRVVLVLPRVVELVVTVLVVVLVVVEVLFVIVVVLTGGALVLGAIAGTLDLVAFALALAMAVCILTGSLVATIGIGTRRLEVQGQGILSRTFEEFVWVTFFVSTVITVLVWFMTTLLWTALRAKSLFSAWKWGFLVAGGDAGDCGAGRRAGGRCFGEKACTLGGGMRTGRTGAEGRGISRVAGHVGARAGARGA